MERAIAIDNKYLLLENGNFLKVRDDLDIGKAYGFNLTSKGLENLKEVPNFPVKIDFDTGRRIYKGFKNSYLIDVRKKSEYHENRVPYSVNMPLKRIEHLSDINIKYDDIVMVYCNNEKRSKEAQNILDNQGFKLVFDLGGIVDYQGEFDNL